MHPSGSGYSSGASRICSTGPERFGGVGFAGVGAGRWWDAPLAFGKGSGKANRAAGSIRGSPEGGTIQAAARAARRTSLAGERFFQYAAPSSRLRWRCRVVYEPNIHAASEPIANQWMMPVCSAGQVIPCPDTSLLLLVTSRYAHHGKIPEPWCR